MDYREKSANPIERIKNEEMSSKEAAYLWNLVYNRGRILTYGKGDDLLETMGYFIPFKISKTCAFYRTSKFSHLNDNAITVSSATETQNVIEDFIRQRPTHIIFEGISGDAAKQLLFDNGYSILISTDSSNVKSFLKRLQMEPINVDPSDLTTLDALVKFSTTGDSNELISIHEVIKTDTTAELNVELEELRDVENSVAFKPEHRKHEMKELKQKQTLLDCLVKHDITSDQHVHTIIRQFNKTNPDDPEKWVKDNFDIV